MLQAEALDSGYGESQVLFGVTLAVDAGEVLALLGRNGMGKTTTVRTIMGQLPCRRGAIRIDGAPIMALPPYRIAQLGVGLVPEGRQIFPTLTAEENLRVTARPGAWDLPRVHALFPRLRERRRSLGRLLSGGEQQMLAIGRALLTQPRLLILDEATEGLAPVIRAEIWSALAALKAEGLAILLIDKNVSAVLRLAERAVILEKGRSVWSGTSAALADAPSVREAFLHV